MKFSELQRLQRREGITVLSSDARIEQLEARLCAITKERDALQAKIEAKEQEPPRGWWDDLIADISAIDCMYRGSPTYAHDAYWMRDRVVWMLKQRRDSTPGVNGEAK